MQNEKTEATTKIVSILSVDAWRDGDGWTWNNWHRVGSIALDTLDSLDSNRKILNYMRREGYLSAGSAGRVAIDDDQYNVVVVDKNTREPIFAIAYGEAQ